MGSIILQDKMKTYIGCYYMMYYQVHCAKEDWSCHQSVCKKIWEKKKHACANFKRLIYSKDSNYKSSNIKYKSKILDIWRYLRELEWTKCDGKEHVVIRLSSKGLGVIFIITKKALFSFFFGGNFVIYQPRLQQNYVSTAYRNVLLLLRLKT